MPRRRATPPLWFSALLVVAYVAVCHLFALHDLETAPVQQAFIGWLITLASIIWNGVQATFDAVIAFLSWAVNALFWLVQTTYNALVDVAKVAMKGLTKTWQFFRDTFDHVLKPAWLKFWKLVDSVRDTLNRVLGPVFKILRRIRDELLHLYTKWVRPVLDTISVTRQMLAVLSALHVKFAKKLDAKLAALEEAIDRPFRFVLGKLNEVINFVNRIATADGLFQRLALVRSLERDVRYLTNIWWNAQLKGMTPEERARRAGEKYAREDTAAMGSELGTFYASGEGKFAGIITELVPLWRASADYPDAFVESP